jgi:peptidyl-prolyl cis-trans isomerase D
LVRWVYEKKVNDVSEAFELGDTYIVAVITGEDKAGLASVETAKPQVEGIIRDQKKAEKIKPTLKGSSIDAIAASVKSIVQKADSLNFTYSVIPGLGNEPKLVGAAFNKSLVNKVSAPIAGNAGVFVISVNNVSASQAIQDANFFKEESINRTRSAIFRSNTSLKKVAKIEDNRSKIF